jgi:hypothetical protein
MQCIIHPTQAKTVTTKAKHLTTPTAAASRRKAATTAAAAARKDQHAYLN